MLFCFRDLGNHCFMWWLETYSSPRQYLFLSVEPTGTHLNEIVFESQPCYLKRSCDSVVYKMTDVLSLPQCVDSEQNPQRYSKQAHRLCLQQIASEFTQIPTDWQLSVDRDGRCIQDEINDVRDESVGVGRIRKPKNTNGALNALRPRQNYRHSTDDILKCIFNGNAWILLMISLGFVSKVPINNIPAFVQIMAWRRPGDKPVS